jgi:hypothetical protein
MIPTELFMAHLDWTWPDVRYALDQRLIAGDAPIQLPRHYLAMHPEATGAVLELASEDVDGPLGSLVDTLAEQELRTVEGQPRERCLYVLMAWIFHQRESFGDPLAIVEEVYADFDYPEQLKSIVRYMPAEELRAGQVEGDDFLYENWASYLSRGAASFGTQRAPQASGEA